MDLIFAPSALRGYRDLLLGEQAMLHREHRGGGFTVTRVEHMALPKSPKFVSPAVMGSATAPAEVGSFPHSSLSQGAGKDQGRAAP